jgi:hypothetical protein
LLAECLVDAAAGRRELTVLQAALGHDRLVGRVGGAGRLALGDADDAVEDELGIIDVGAEVLGVAIHQPSRDVAPVIE